MGNQNRFSSRNKTRYMTTIGMLCAIAYVFSLIGHFVPIRFNGFLSYDPKDAIIAISGLALGPLSSLIISVVVSFLELITISTTGFIGLLMNIISSVAFSCIAAIIYKYRKSIGGAVLGLALSSVATVVLMILWNYLITPFYMGVPRDVIASMILPVFLPFNVIKCGLNAALTMLIYKPCVRAMRSVGLIKSTAKTGKSQSKRTNIVVSVVSASIIGILVALYVILK